MKKIILPLALLAPLVLMSGCTTVRTGVYPGYNNDYVYSVGYYGYRPFTGNPYYSGNGWGNNYWYGHRGFYGYGGYYSRGWNGRMW